MWLGMAVVARAEDGQSRLKTDADARLYQTLVPPRNHRAGGWVRLPCAAKGASGTVKGSTVHGVLVIKKTAVLPLLLALAVSSCTKDAGKAPAEGAATPAATPAAAPAAGGGPAPDGPAPGAGGPPAAEPAVKPVPPEIPAVVARVNGEDVKKAELDMAIRSLEDRARSPVPPEQRDAVYRQVLDRIIGFHLLVQEAKARKVVAPPWEVDSQLEQIKKQFPSEDAFKQMLQTRGVTVEQLRADTAQTIAVNVMLKSELEPKVAVTEADSKKFYEENKPRFHQDDSVHASHILIRTPEQADAAAKAKARAQADDLLAQAKKGADFAGLAKQFSQDPGSAPNGGDLGFFSKGQMVPAFEQAAFSLEPGQTSGVVETPFGYHIIRVSETKAGRDLGYEEVKAQIEDYLKQQMRERKSQEFVDSLKAKGKIRDLHLISRSPHGTCSTASPAGRSCGGGRRGDHRPRPVPYSGARVA